MSTAETDPGTSARSGERAPWPSAATPASGSSLGAAVRLLGSELQLVFGRRRNVVLLVGLAAVPVLLGLALFIAQDSAFGGQGPGFVGRVSGNGLFLVVASLFICLPFLLPLTVGIVAGDTIAGEASHGTLRYLAAVPVPRSRLLAVKAFTAFVFSTAAVAAITVTALIAGLVYFGISDLVLLSGDTIARGEGVLRMLGVGAYVAMSMAGLVAVGVFVSTLTEIPVGAMAATVVVAIVSAVLDSLPQLSAIHPGLLTHHWFDFAEFLRVQVDLGVLLQGAAVQAAWVVLFGALAWSRFTTTDITS